MGCHRVPAGPAVDAVLCAVAEKVVSRSPKVCTVVGKGKKAQVLKNGRCKFRVTRGKKIGTVAFTVRA